MCRVQTQVAIVLDRYHKILQVLYFSALLGGFFGSKANECAQLAGSGLSLAPVEVHELTGQLKHKS